MGENLITRLFARARHALGVDRNDDALAAEALGRAGDKLGIAHGGGVDRNLVGTRLQEPANVFGLAHTAAHRQRHEAALGRASDNVEHDPAALVACGDVEKAQLVRPRCIIGAGRFDRIAGIAQIDEIDTLHHAAVLDVETGNDANLEAHGLSSLMDRVSANGHARE